MQKLSKAWKNRKKIWEGMWNSWFPNSYVEGIAKERLQICRSNICGFHDKDGISEAAYVKGAESCSSCGCKLSFAVRSLSKECGIVEKGLPPLWESKMSQEEEDSFREKTGIKNE